MDLSKHDLIHIKDLLVRGVIGVNDWEREVEQDILVNITLGADLRLAAADDDIEKTVNYKTISKQVIEHIQTHQPLTVEALASDLAQICLAQPGVLGAQVRVEKPGALRFARSVGVEILRGPADLA